MNRSTDVLKEIERLEQEIKEKKQRLVELKQSLPHKRVKNYRFTDSYGRPVTLAQLFGDKEELLVIQNMGKSCPYCTMWADGFNGLYHHLAEKCAFVVATPDPPEVQNSFAAERRWQFRLISTMGTTFKEDFGFLKDGTQYPGVSAFKKDESGGIYHVTDAHFGPWDDFCPAWPLFDLLPSGSSDYFPRRKINQNSPFQMTNNIALQMKNAKEAVRFYEGMIGMAVEDSSEKETRLSFGGQKIYVEEAETDSPTVCFEFAVDDFQHVKSQLLEHGCRITKVFGEKSAMLEDPFGLCFHIFESVN